MGAAYLNYLLQWKANGGELFVHYNDVGGYSKYGIRRVGICYATE